MAKNTERKKRRQPSADNKREFFSQFAREAQYIRDDIVKDLPAFNMLLNAKAESFEEVALRLCAQERGVPFQKDAPPMPPCPHCGKHERVGSKGKGAYYCNSCKRKFTASHDSIASGTKCDAIVWMKVLICLLNFSGLTKTCEYCGIAPKTYYQIRNRLFYAMQLMMAEVKLYGIVEVDNTFVRASYKGMDLSECEFPEESIFFDDSYRPRAARPRGAPNPIRERNANNICIFTAIDEEGHVLTRFAGVGIASARILKNYIPEDKFLIEVPKSDSFKVFAPKKNNSEKSKPGSATRIVADKEKAIEKYAGFLGVEFESHVYREKGVQRQLHGNAHNIQRVNALHRRLKDFLRKANYVSSKYLPGYLVFFEFLENTSASQDAISYLFQILATPGLGKTSGFYQDMYSVPNYLQEWFDSDHPLKKLPYNKLLAFYLYDHIRNKEAYPDTDITMEYIEEVTGYTPPSIRRFYRNLSDAGYRELILKFFGEPGPDKTQKPKERRPRQQVDASKTINPVVLEIYDEYAAMRILPKKNRISLQELLDKKNKQYGTDFKRTNMLAKFRYIEEKKIREPLPDLKRYESICGIEISDKVLSIYNDYQALVKSYREKGEAPPLCDVMFAELGEKYKLATDTIGTYVETASMYINRSRATNKDKKQG